MFVLYSYAVVTRRWQPALAHSLLSATFQSDDVRSMSSTKATPGSAAVGAANCIARAGVANNVTVDANGTGQSLDKPGSSSTAGGHNEGNAQLSVEQLEKKSAEVEETPGGPVHAEREREHGQLVGSRGNSPDSVSSTEVWVHGRMKSIKDYLAGFIQGTKLLWSEIILARKLSAKQKAGYPLSFQEQRLQRQVQTPSCFFRGGTCHTPGGADVSSSFIVTVPKDSACFDFFRNARCHDFFSGKAFSPSRAGIYTR